MWTFLAVAFAVLVPVLFVASIAYVIYVIARRGFELKQLVADGVETGGTIVSKRTLRSSRGGTTRQLTYEYHDPLGQAHRHASLVSRDEYDAYENGQSIDVVYSASRPEVSAPKFLVEQTRPALERRRQAQGK